MSIIAWNCRKVSKISYFSPKPKQKPKRLPRQRPLKTIPSALGDQGIVGNWLFYYLKGGDHLHDFSPYKNHGTISGAKWKDGRYGWALEFDGVDDYVNVPDDPSLDVDEITLSAWIKPNNITPEQGILGRTDSDVQVYNFYSESNDDRVRFEIFVGGSGNPDLYTNALTNGQWYFLVLTYDGSVFKAYQNGELLNSDDSRSGALDSSTSPFHIGNWYSGSPSFDGTIAIVRLYKVAKSSSWISRRFEQTRGIFGV